MENREEVIGDCRAVMDALADCGSIDTEMEAVSSEMEVTAGLIQKLVDENATRKLDQHDYRKKYDGYASRYAALESRMDSFSMRSCSTGLLIMQRSIPTAGWFSPSATEWKSAQRFKARSGRSIGYSPDAFGRFFCV